MPDYDVRGRISISPVGPSAFWVIVAFLVFLWVINPGNYHWRRGQCNAHIAELKKLEGGDWVAHLDDGSYGFWGRSFSQLCPDEFAAAKRGCEIQSDGTCR